MQSLTKILPVTILSLAAAIPMIQAQEAVTTPVGAMTYSFPATTQLTSTYISVPLTNQPVFSGKVFTVGTNTLTFEGTPFTAGAFTQAGAPHFLRMQDGPQAGRMVLITANTANTLTVDVTDNSSQTTNLNTAGFAVAVGNQAQVVPGDTLASFFGDNTPGNPVALVGGTSSFAADTVSIYNKVTARFDTYFFNTTAGSASWRLGNSATNVNSTVLFPESAIVVNRRPGRPAMTMTVVGEVPTVGIRTKTLGSNQVSHVGTRYPVDIKLSQFAPVGWVRGNSTFTADTLSIFNPTTARMDTYFQLGNGTWRRSNDANTDQSNVLIPAGSSVAILKRSSSSNETSFTQIPLPYQL